MIVMQETEQARKRAEVIMKVRAGRMTAKKAAEVLKVSRKTYYEWESRGLEGMMDALANRPTGRPQKPKDLEKAKLQKKLLSLEKELRFSEHKLELRRLVEGWPSLEELMGDEANEKSEKKS